MPAPVQFLLSPHACRDVFDLADVVSGAPSVANERGS